MSIVSSVTALAAAPAALAIGFGYAPRLGPGRAVALALNSRLFLRANPSSQRVNDVGTLRGLLKFTSRDQYVVVTGPKGVGKTCIVESATQHTCGVVTVRVPAGTPEEKILEDVFTAVTRFYARSLDKRGSAQRVLWWHHLLFRVPATIVLQASERKPTQPHADIDSAARALSRDFGMRVVVDASNNLLPGSALAATLREMVLDVEPMPRATLEALPELAPLLAALRTAHLADTVWSVSGGVPALYLLLRSKWEKWKERGECSDLEPIVADFVLGNLKKAVHNIGDAVAVDKSLQTLFDGFRGVACVPYSVLKALQIVRPSPDKVLRAVFAVSAGGVPEDVLVPADAATALILRCGLTEVPTMAALAALLATPPGA